MPASRIAFALADFLSEAGRLLPRDHVMSVTIKLDSVAFDRIVYELAEYGNVARPVKGGPPVDSVTFGGVVIERIGA